MKTVMAQGTFDILHPGHLHYLEKSSELGGELVVVIARDSRVEDKKDIYFEENERKRMVQALEKVDKAVLGSEGDIYGTVKKINPDIVTLGYDQEHNEQKVKEMAEQATGQNVEVMRISQKECYSSSQIKES